MDGNKPHLLPHINNFPAVNFFSPLSLAPALRETWGKKHRSLDLVRIPWKNQVPQPTRKEECQFSWGIWMEKKRENFKLLRILKYLVLVLGTWFYGIFKQSCNTAQHDWEHGKRRLSSQNDAVVWILNVFPTGSPIKWLVPRLTTRRWWNLKAWAYETDL